MSLYGEQLIIRCNISSNPYHKRVYWAQVVNGTKTIINHGTIRTHGITPENPSLIFQYSTYEDTGYYTCFAVNDIGTGQSESVHIKIYGGRYYTYIFVCFDSRNNLVQHTLHKNKSIIRPSVYNY